MKIGVDITMLVYTGSGVANYTFNLIKNLLLIDKKNEYRLFYSSLRRPKNFYYLEELKKLGGKIYNYRFPPTLLELWWSKLHIIPVEWFIGKVDIYFSSDFYRPPLLKGTKGITTVHDLIWKLYPDFHVKRIIDAHDKKLEETIKHQDIILVDSKNSEIDLIKYYPDVDKTKIKILYPGIRDDVQPIKDKSKIEKAIKKYFPQFSIKNDKYLLYVGAIEPRKNLDKAILAFQKILRTDPKLISHFLIIGRMGWKNEKIFNLVKDLHLEKKVKFLGFVQDNDLPYFLSGAKLLLYLSSYEGFGLPPLEALACGTKVLAGNNSSMKEVIDEKYLVDVDNSQAVILKIKELLNDSSLVDWKNIKEKFSWRRSAQEFLKIINSI